MSTTGQEIFKLSMSLIDEMLDDGTLDTDAVANYQAKAPSILTMLQAKYAKKGKIFTTYEISKCKIEPLIGSFDYYNHDVDDENHETQGQAKAYYFETNGEGTVYIEDFTGTWNTLATINVPNTVSTYTAYSGLVTPTSGATKSRIRFSGSYYYSYGNFALFKENFASTSKIPVYNRYIEYSMPSNFSSVDQITEESYPVGYVRSTDYYWEGRNKLYLSYELSGNIRITYVPNPTVITALSQTLEVDDVTANGVLPYELASMLMATEDVVLTNYHEQKLQEAKFDITDVPLATINPVQDVYGGL